MASIMELLTGPVREAASIAKPAQFARSKREATERGPSNIGLNRDAMNSGDGKLTACALLGLSLIGGVEQTAPFRVGRTAPNEASPPFQREQFGLER
jgi:hypothetical protein